MRPAALLLPLLLLAAAPSPAPAGEEPVVLESAHYRLEAFPPFDEGAEYLEAADSLYGLLKDHFGAEPKEKGKLVIRMWPDREGFLAGGRADGVDEGSLSAGGVYWTGTKRAYFWRQPSPSFTRHLFLHELTHQFHYLAVMGNQARCPGWYSEGLAEYFGYHRFDGEKVVPGSGDVLGLEEDIPRMVQEAQRGEFDLEAVVEGKRGADKPPSWAAVHWLLAGGDAKATARFRAAEKKMWRGLTGKPLVDAVLGPDRKKAKAAARAHLASIDTTWKVEWIQWDARGSDPVGESATVGLLRTRNEPATGSRFVEATLEVASGSAGLVLGFKTVDDFLAVYRRPSGRIDLVRRVGGKWETPVGVDRPTGSSLRLRAEVAENGAVRVLADGKVVLEAHVPKYAAEGAVGFFVDGGKARFRDPVLPPGTRSAEW